MTTTSDTPTPTVESVWEDVLDVQRRLRRLASLDLGFLAEEDVDGLVGEVEAAARVWPVVQQALTAQVMDRGMAETYGCTSPMAYLQTKLRLRRSEANQRVGAAERFQPRTAMTGEKLAPRFPAVAEALAEGAVSMDHATVIATSVEHLPAAVSEENKAHQELHLRKEQHGMWRLSGRFDAENAAAIQASLSLLAKPKEQPDGSRDPRPAALRRAEALMSIVRWSLDHDGQPTSGGDRPHINVTVTLADLEARAPGRLTTGDVISGETIQRMLCDAITSTTVISTVGAILYQGRDLRLVTEAQRKALIARDKGCAFPGCDAPPWFCDAHHVWFWKDGGPTDITNLTLLCRRHHLLVHKAGSDWRIIMIRGVPHTIAPAWLDPSRTPQRNTAHDPP